MKELLNGAYVEMDEAEVSEINRTKLAAEIAERTRPMTAEEVTAMLIKQQINTITVDDNTALRMVAYYPEWAADTDYSAGYKVQRGGKLCRCLQAHTSQVGWEPENTQALWEYINETHDGTLYDPIPYEGNMELIEGLYYTQDGVTYLCNRSTGQPVYNAMSDLVGLYVEVAE